MADNQSETLAITTQRLIIRDFREVDLSQVLAFRSDPDATWFMDDLPETPEQTRAWLEGAIHHNRLRPRSAYNLAITTRDDDHVIGWIGFGDTARYPGAGNYGVGYMLGSAHWGTGYGTEALRAIVQFIFTSQDGSLISAWCDAANPTSARVMERSGFSFVRQFEGTDPKTGQPRNCLEYATTQASPR